MNTKLACRAKSRLIATQTVRVRKERKMTRIDKKTVSVCLVAVLGATFAMATAAWACTGAQAQVSILPRAAAIGEPIKVVSNGFSPGTPVEIRWNSATGPVVGSEVGPDNSVAVAVPSDAKPGLYYLVVMQPLDGSKLGAGSFEVLASAAKDGIAGPQSSGTTQRVSADLWGGFSANQTADVSVAASPAQTGSPAALMGLGLVAASSAALMFALVFAGLSARERSRQGTAASHKPAPN